MNSNDSNDEILKENLKILNKKYGPLRLRFIIYKDKIIVLEHYVIGSNVQLKEELQYKFDLHFPEYYQNEKVWFVGAEGMKKLRRKLIRIMPIKPIQELREELERYINMINESDLKDSIRELLEIDDGKFYISPGAQYRHHAYKGGLLEHTVQTTKLALLIKNEFPDLTIDDDLLLAGAILHDIGKINCYEFDNNLIIRTTIFEEQEHIIHGIKLVSQNITSKKLDDLLHIIASHHNLKEWGSPVQPKTDEAWLIHFVENLSSKIMG
ncbi:MAG: HD domain-containing protein [Candidatus Helarchaeota archaeon]